jgi:hypothetical protein
LSYPAFPVNQELYRDIRNLGGPIQFQTASDLSRGNRFESNAAGLSGPAVRLHDDLNVLLERSQHLHQAFGRIVVKITPREMRKVGLRDADLLGGLRDSLTPATLKDHGDATERRSAEGNAGSASI